jgi:hypothetical protein
LWLSRRGRSPEQGDAALSISPTLPLGSATNSSAFWIILLLVWRIADHQMIFTTPEFRSNEPLTLNQRVQGSNPCAPTKIHRTLQTVIESGADFRLSFRQNFSGSFRQISSFRSLFKPLPCARTALPHCGFGVEGCHGSRLVPAQTMTKNSSSLA